MSTCAGYLANSSPQASSAVCSTVQTSGRIVFHVPSSFPTNQPLTLTNSTNKFNGSGLSQSYSAASSRQDRRTEVHTTLLRLTTRSANPDFDPAATISIWRTLRLLNPSYPPALPTSPVSAALMLDVPKTLALLGWCKRSAVQHSCAIPCISTNKLGCALCKFPTSPWCNTLSASSVRRGLGYLCVALVEEHCIFTAHPSSSGYCLSSDSLPSHPQAISPSAGQSDPCSSSSRSFTTSPSDRSATRLSLKFPPRDSNLRLSF